MSPYVQLCLVLGTESAILEACVGFAKCLYRAEPGGILVGQRNPVRLKPQLLYQLSA